MFEGWNEATKTLLRERRGKGIPFDKIGKELGVSKNACISCADRIGIPRIARKDNPNIPHRPNKLIKAKRGGQNIFHVGEKPKAALKIAPQLDAPASKQIPICETLPNHCRYIAGEDRLCCGHDTVKDSSWCGYHWKVVHQAPAQAPVRRGVFIDFHRRVA